jgi:endonuclease YncB( thermonuclease family)
MFYAIHRAIKFALFCGVVWILWKAYEHREVAEPALIWYDVWDNGGFNEKPAPTMNGHVERVLSSQTFVMAGTNHVRYNVRLAGLRDPSKELSVAAVEREKKRRDALADLIEAKDIRLAISYENFNNLGGIVFVGATNINAQLVHEGLAFTDKELVKGFPKEIQYQMLWSSRHRIAAK